MDNNKIYTKTGDDGFTQFLDTRVKKCCLGIKCLGAVDELLSSLGFIYSQVYQDYNTTGDTFYINLCDQILLIQKRLFTLNAMIATKIKINNPLTNRDVELLEQWIDTYDVYLPELKNFIIPSGSIVGSYIHLTRSICRRAETLLIEDLQNNPQDRICIMFINRLSDYLFVLARRYNQYLGTSEIVWRD